ncbi:hypothetical protein Tco_0405496 [Tanacetum coccineum]
MVACLVRTEENADFHQIVDFLNASTISLDAEQDSGNILKTQSTAIPNVPLSQGIGTGGSPRRKSLDKENVSKQGRNLKTMPMFKEGDFNDDFDDIDDMVNEAMENVEGDTVNTAYYWSKGIMQEPEKPPKNPIKAQIQRDAEIAQRLFLKKNKHSLKSARIRLGKELQNKKAQ